MTEPKTAIQKAVELFDGSPAKLAAAIGGVVVRQHIEHWLRAGRVPTDHCAAVESATGGVVTRRDLRPDDWRSIWPELERRTARRESARARA